MLDPAIDRAGEPFSYFSKPTDVLGVMDGRWERLFAGGFSLLPLRRTHVLRGKSSHPIEQRVKTLLRGYLPVIQYSYAEGGIRYSSRCLPRLRRNPESHSSTSFA